MFSQKASTASTSPSRTSVGHHDLAHLGDVVVGAAGELRRQGVRAEKGEPHGHRPFASEPARRAQLFALVFERQPVAGLDLDGRHAFGQQRIQSRQRFRHQLRFARGARGVHRRENAAALFGDRFVRNAVQALFEFVGARAGVDQVRVAVDEAGRDQPALAVGVLRGVESARRLRFGAGINNESVAAGDEAIAR